MKHTLEEFKEKKPKMAALHWDGKLIKNVTGKLQELESILVSGAPNYKEGKLLNVSKLEDKGNPSNTAEAKVLAIIEQLKIWGLKDSAKALVFDNKAFNS